jgi:hypothetical protein
MDMFPFWYFYEKLWRSKVTPRLFFLEVVQDTMADKGCDGYGNTAFTGPNDVQALVPIMVDRSNTNLRLRGPPVSDSQHGVVIGASLSGDEDRENVDTSKKSINNINQSFTLFQNTSAQLDLREGTQSTTTTSNINILALAAEATSMVQTRVTFESSPVQNFPLREISMNRQQLNASASPLTESTRSRGENESVTAPVSTSNVAYQAATDGAYLSIPETVGLRGINCLNEDAHENGYDSDGEMGPFFDAVTEEQQ